MKHTDMRKLATLFFSMGLSLVASVATQAADGTNDAVKALVAEKCAGCHGDAGEGIAANIPRLAGQHADYLYKQLRNFLAAGGEATGPDNPLYPTPSDLVYVAAPEGRLPERMNPIGFLAMNGMVHGLSDQDMKQLALYFSSLPAPAATAAPAETDLAAARQLYLVGDPSRQLPACSACHGPGGAGMPAQFPRLAGQSAHYTEMQLRNFRSGDRHNDPNGMMRDSAYKLSDAEIRELSLYIAGLH